MTGPIRQAAPPHRVAQPALFIDAQHGLGNRLRAIASAAVIAAATGRRLVIIWRRDAHCGARLDELFAYHGPVIDDDAADLMRSACARVYNYMEIEPGARHREPVLAEPGAGDVYVRSAYALVSPHSDRAGEDRFLHGLRPAPAVQALVQTVPYPSDVALHVRMATGPAFDHLAHEAPGNWPPARHRDLTEWRRKSDVERFIARLDRLLIDHPEATIFAAADLASTYDRLFARYGRRLRWLPRDRFDRSAAQVQEALADLILLTAAPLFLASGWSAFSELAIRLARPGRRTETSGIDF